MKKQFLFIFLIITSTVAISQSEGLDNGKKKDSIQSFSSSEEIAQNSFQQNKSEKEWNKFKKFKDKLDKSDTNQKIYLNEIRTYSKDSLQILEVKLLSILELEGMELLEVDISQNTMYYISILEALKSSKIDPSEYRFLENKLALLFLKSAKEKYTLSKSINIILGILVLYLLFYIFSVKRKQKTPQPVSLSKQEINIKNYILEGKSNKEIADNLFISLSTVKTHITSIYKKLNVSNRAELVLKLKNSTGTST